MVEFMAQLARQVEIIHFEALGFILIENLFPTIPKIINITLFS
jgi:hypothetical protein